MPDDDRREARTFMRDAPQAPQSGLAKALSLYSAYGWRGRIGLIAPSTNTTIEPEFALVLPRGVSVHASRVHQAGGQEYASYRRMADEIAVAAAHLATAEVDVVTFGCTSCTYFIPPEEVSRSMTEIAGCPAILVADAVVEGLRAVGARRVALLTPRTSFVTEREVAFLSAEGFEVTGVHGLGLGVDEEERRAIGRVPPETLYRMALEIHEDADAVFISCTQLPTLGLVSWLEEALGRPVVTSNQAIIWRCLRTLGARDRISGFGALLELP